LKSGDRFLLAIHNNIRLENHGKWGLPGGRVEFGEDPEATARRELAEELDIQLEALRFVGDYEYKERMHKVFGSEFEGDIVSFDQNEILEIGWHSLAQVRRFEEDGKLHTGFEHIAIREYIHLID
jgi:8-oxo-dGTP pyrophosphatase MutT (NUDIX family)